MHLSYDITGSITKDRKKNILCIMGDVRGDFLGPPHGTQVSGFACSCKFCGSLFSTRDNFGFVP